MPGKALLVLTLLVATPLLPGLPDFDPDDPGSPPPPEQRPAEPDRPPPPSSKAERVCARMAAPWGSDRASGAPRDPFRTPGRLAEKVPAGRTGCLREGTYVQREVVIHRRKVTLRSSPGERATWRGRVVLAGRRDKLVDLNLDGSAGPRCSKRGCGTLPNPTINAPEVVVSDNDITDQHSGICVSTRAWYGEHPDRFVIQRNRIHDCGQRPPTNQHHGIYVVEGKDGLIRDNVIVANADRGIQLYPDAVRTRVLRNTVDGNGSGVIISKRSSGNVIRDNVLTNSVVRWNAESWRLTGTGNRFEGNCLRAGNPDPAYNENGGVRLSPLVAQSGNFVASGDPYRDRAKGDYRPPDSNPCAGKGSRAKLAGP
jgi:hypothetical protein